MRSRHHLLVSMRRRWSSKRWCQWGNHCVGIAAACTLACTLLATTDLIATLGTWLHLLVEVTHHRSDSVTQEVCRYFSDAVCDILGADRAGVLLLYFAIL